MIWAEKYMYIIISNPTMNPAKVFFLPHLLDSISISLNPLICQKIPTIPPKKVSNSKAAKTNIKAKKEGWNFS